MHYRVGRCRCLMFAILLASVLHGGRCAPEGEQPAAANGQSQSSGISTFVTATMSEASKIGSEVTTATEEALKAAGRISMTAIRVLVKLLGGASQTTAAAGTAIASTVQQVNKVTGPVPVIGTVTTGVENLITGTTKAFKANSDFNTERRDEMLNEWQGQLDRFNPGSKKSAAAGAEAEAAVESK